MLAVPVTSSAQVGVGVSISIGPPALPFYPQPVGPGPGYIWTPGYWAYGDNDYFWVPGTWVLAPAVGLLWTPGWWGVSNGFYAWHRGYWGPHVGFYGGINYGYGYDGHGYAGGYWRHGAFYYNRSVNNVNGTNIHNTYNKTVIDDTRATRISYNGGPSGISARPTSAEQAAARGHQIPPTAVQIQHERVAGKTPTQRVSANHGMPEIAATPRPGKFTGNGVVRINHTKGSYDYPAKDNSAGVKNHAKEGATMKQAPHPKAERQRKPDEESRPPPR